MKKNRLYAFLLAVAVILTSVALPKVLSLRAAEEGEVVWRIDFGGTGDEFFSIAAVPGGIVAVGCNDDFDTPDWNGVEGYGDTDAIIVKFDGGGGVVWVRSFGGAGDELFSHVAAVDGGVAAVGYSSHESFGTGDWNGVSGWGYTDAIIVMYDHDGNVVWQNRFGGIGYDQFYSVAAVPGGVVAVGYSSELSFGTGDWDGVTGRGNTDAIIVMYDNDGIELWKRHFGGDGGDGFSSVAAVPGGVVAVGESTESSFGTGDWAGVDAKGNVVSTIVKYSLDGDIVWQSTFSGGMYDYLNGVIAVDGGVIVAGGSHNDGSPWTADLADNECRGAFDGIIAKFGDDGGLVWVRNFGGADFDAFNSVTEVTGGFVVSGVTEDNTTGDWVGMDPKGDVVLVKFDYSGNVLGKWSYDIKLEECYYLITRVPDGVVMTGWENGPFITKHCFYDDRDFTQPTAAPTSVPTSAPTAKPTEAPTTEPTIAPTVPPEKELVIYAAYGGSKLLDVISISINEDDPEPLLDYQPPEGADTIKSMRWSGAEGMVPVREAKMSGL